MKGAIRTLAALGVQVLVQTNAAGSLDPRMPPGSLMLISDHLNLVQRSPLFHEPGDKRFVDMGDAYCPRCAPGRAAAAAAGIAAARRRLRLGDGPAVRDAGRDPHAAAFGAQAVGMSTVPETILARHAGLRVLALSMITNMAAGMDAQT
jgi:purine-nucleoside phosphorylase